MDDGLALPWWEYYPSGLAVPGSVVQLDARTDESTVKAFLQAGSRAETAERFISANSLRVTGVLEALSRDELVFLTAEELEALGDARFQAPPRTAQFGASTTAAARSSLRCRSRLLGLPLADRHAALTVACSLGHRLPRRALVDFLCRLVLGDDVNHAQTSLSHYIFAEESEAFGSRRRNGTSCACGGRGLLGKPTTAVVGRASRESADLAVQGYSVAPCAACRACLARREWLDPFSAHLLSIACRKLLWARGSSDEEVVALNRCLAALSGALTPPEPERSWPEGYWEKGTLYLNPDEENSPGRDVVGTLSRMSTMRGTRPTPTMKTDDDVPRCNNPGWAGAESSSPSHPGRGSAGTRRGVSFILSGVRGKPQDTNVGQDNDEVRFGVDNRHGVVPAARKRPRCATEADDFVGSASQPPPHMFPKGRPTLPPAKHNDPVLANVTENSHAAQGSAVSLMQENDDVEERTRQGGERGKGVNGATMTSVVNTGSDAAAVRHIVSDETTDREENAEAECLPTALRDKLKVVAEKVVSAGVRGATFIDIHGAAAEAVSLLQDSVASNAQPTAIGRAFGQPQHQQQKPKQPLEVVCQGLGLDKPLGMGEEAAGGCRDDLVMAVCSRFVTPALSLRNCLTFVSTVLVPRARALAGPASRLLVTAVSEIGKARPEAVIDGLILPLLCDTDPLELGSAQCELCTRLIKQVLPKHTLEGVLCGLCGASSQDSSCNGDPDADGGRACVWTELTIPMLTAALNLKPPLSDVAISVLVRRVEASSEQPELQKSLKFTTLVHSLVTRYGPQVKPYLASVRTAIGRCSTFMVKTVLGALQRLDK